MWSLLFFNYASTTFCFNIFIFAAKTHATYLLQSLLTAKFSFPGGIKSQYWIGDWTMEDPALKY